MTMAVPGEPCYLIEWFRPALTEEPLERAAAKLAACTAALSADGPPIRLLTLVAVPTDEVVFGVVAAASANIVALACQRAGLPAERITAAATIGQAS